MPDEERTSPALRAAGPRRPPFSIPQCRCRLRLLARTAAARPRPLVTPLPPAAAAGRARERSSAAPSRQEQAPTAADRQARRQRHNCSSRWPAAGPTVGGVRRHQQRRRPYTAAPGPRVAGPLGPGLAPATATRRRRLRQCPRRLGCSRRCASRPQRRAAALSAAWQLRLSRCRRRRVRARPLRPRLGSPSRHRAGGVRRRRPSSKACRHLLCRAVRCPQLVSQRCKRRQRPAAVARAAVTWTRWRVRGRLGSQEGTAGQARAGAGAATAAATAAALALRAWSSTPPRPQRRKRQGWVRRGSPGERLKTRGAAAAAAALFPAAPGDHAARQTR